MKNLWKALKMVCSCAPGAFWRRALYVLLQSLLPLVTLYILKQLVDAVGGMGNTSFLPWLAGMCGVYCMNRIIGILDGVNSDVLGQRLTDRVNELIQNQAARLDMAYYDNPDYHDTLHRAQLEAGTRPMQVYDNMMAVGGALISIAGITAILVSVTWWVIPVMILAVLPSFAVRLHKAHSIYAFRRANTSLFRLTTYLSGVLTRREFAKELRAYRATPFFRRRYTEARASLTKRIISISRRLGAIGIVCAFIEAVAMLAVVWMLAHKTAVGSITIGTFVMLFESYRRGQGYLTTLVSAVANLYDNRLFVSNLFEYLNLQPQIVDPEHPEPVPAQIDTIEFRDITFRYPGMERDVLTHYNMTARCGEVTMLQGHNGAGKSTLVNLLLRLYEPQEGGIYVNGIDLKQFNAAEWRQQVGVLFQDFGRYCLTVDENIALGENQIHKHNDLLEFVSSLPKGYDSQLGRLFDGGSELSMGQWQRVAISRALSTEAPVMVFDEPTAWMDMATRERFSQIVDHIKQNRIVLMIAHK